ncbi:MAG: hypothetical protein ABJB05_02990 [Parafilimonas sp.]
MEDEINIAGASDNILATADKSIKENDKNSSEKLLFAGKNIGISISDNPDLLKLGYSPMHLQDAGIEFARYLIVHGAKLIYGGDIREHGFTNLFAELAKLYTTKDTCDESHFKSYLAWPIHLKLTKTNELDYRQNKVEIVKMPLPGTIHIDSTTFIDADTNEHKTIWAKSITYMRDTMNTDCNARIFLGGPVQNFRGKYPGLVEEAWLALSKDIPVYLVGTFGGATKEIINLLVNKSSTTLSEEFQLSDKDYDEFYKYWNVNEDDKIDYKQLSSLFINYGLEKICNNNGLTEEENKRLFITNSLMEMIYLVLKGLTEIKTKTL